MAISIAADAGWSIIASSVRGASHLRSGAPNQDAYATRTGTDGTQPLVLAVSDGHGSARCFRSATGARLATEIAVDLTHEFLLRSRDLNPSQVKASIERGLCAEFVREWRRRVALDLADRPFTAPELDVLRGHIGDEAAARQAETQPQLAYGATLLVVGLDARSLIYMQLGDGDILVTDDEGTDTPLPEAPELIANETTSLCMPDAQRHFRSRYQYLQGDAPPLIMLSTDGLSSAYATPEDFRRLGPDIRDILREHGENHVRRELPQWLADASVNGSGDDVTAVIAIRRPQVAAGLAA